MVTPIWVVLNVRSHTFFLCAPPTRPRSEERSAASQWSSQFLKVRSYIVVLSVWIFPKDRRVCSQTDRLYEVERGRHQEESLGVA